MTYSSEVLADSPLAYYRLGESSGTTMTDSSGNGRDGTYSTPPTLGVAGLLAGDADTCADWSGDNAVVPYGSWANASAVTIEAWVRFDNTASAAEVIACRWSVTASQRAWNLNRSATGKLSLSFYETSNTLRTINGATTLAAGVTYHVVATIAAGSQVLYVNGVSDATGSFATFRASPTTPNIVVGADQSAAQNMDGKIDEVAYYGTALSSTRVGVHYSAGTTGPTTVNGGQATETSSALTGTVVVALFVAGGLATEADAALTGTVATGVVVSGGQATETDSALTGSVSTAEIVAGGQAVETDSAQPGAALVGYVVAGGVATETNEALSGVTITPLYVSGGQATETDEALAGAVVEGSAVVVIGGIAIEFDIARTGDVIVDGEVLIPEDVPVETDSDLVGVDEVDQDAWDDEWHTYPTVTPLPFPDMWAAWDVAFVLDEDGTKIEKRRARLRDRIVVGGTDITFVNGVRTPVPDYSREKPFSFSAMTLEVPGVNPLSTLLSSLPWFGRHKKVLVQRVNADDEVVVTDYRGVTLDPTGDGAGLTLGVGGLFTGKAAKSWRGWTQRRKADPVYWLHALMRGLRMPLDNDWSFGIDMITPAPGWRSDVGFQIVSESRKRDGEQLTVRYDEDVHKYVAETVDRETIHLTAYLDHGQMRQNLVCDWSNDPTEVFARGYLDSGEKFINIVAPNMTVYETTPTYPIAGGDPFGIGTVDADTIDGAGVSRLILRLIGFRFLKRDDKAGGFDADVERAVTNARIAARMDDYGTGDPMLKMVDEDLWAWLFDADGVGLTMKEARERPIYEVPELGKYDLTASGDLRGLNPNYDGTVPRISEVIDFSTSMDDVSDLTEAARSYVQTGPNWAGTITTQHGFIDGEHNPGDPFDESMIVSNRDVREGMNLWVPNWQGGTLFHIVQVDISDDGFQAQLKVDTRARDAITLDAILDRNERYRRGAAKAYMEERRQSSYDKNAILGYFGRFGGKLTSDEVLTGGSWNVFWVPLGDYGLVQRFRTRVRAIEDTSFEFFEGSNPFAGADGLEHYVRIFGEKVTPAWMNAREPDPSAAIATAVTDYKTAVDDYKTRGRLAAYGATSVDDSPCGYGEDYKGDDGAILSGNFYDDSGFPFRAPDCRAYVAIWVPEDAVQLAGWMFRWQVDEGT